MIATVLKKTLNVHQIAIIVLVRQLGFRMYRCCEFAQGHVEGDVYSIQDYSIFLREYSVCNSHCSKKSIDEARRLLIIPKHDVMPNG